VEMNIGMEKFLRVAVVDFVMFRHPSNQMVMEFSDLKKKNA
jgi:hypothetical protein